MQVDITPIPRTAHTSIDGKPYFRVEFQLCLVFNNLNLDFVLEQQGREIQKVQDIPYAEQGDAITIGN